MRNRLPLLLLSLSLVARAGNADTPGVDLAWDTCAITVASGDLHSACDSNEPGTMHRLVMTIGTDTAVPDLAGLIIVLGICSVPDGLPDWWRFAPGECRDGAFTFPAPTSGLGAGCTDLWSGHDTGGGLAITNVTPNRIRVRMDIASRDTLRIDSGTRYVAGVATLDMRHTVDDGGAACAGCTTGVDLYLESIEVFGFSSGEDQLVSAQHQRVWVKWQGGAPGTGPLCDRDAARNATWGAVKALYR